MSPRLSGPTLPPHDGGPPRSIVVLLHGYGSDGSDLIALGDAWAPAFPGTLFAAPDAPVPCADFPLGYQWFPVTPEILQQGRLEGVRAAAPAVADFLAGLWESTGLGPAQTVLCGFSQGAMMALHVGLGLEAPLAGIIAFSGALVPPARFAAQPAVLLLHGDLDTVVDPRFSREAAALLEERGYDVGLQLFPGLGHSISPEGVAAAVAFLGRVLGA